MAICRQAAEAGAKELLAWRGRFSAQNKAARDFVTDADLASQGAIQAILLGKYPDHGFLGEESPDLRQLDQPFCWVVDPLDGTTNYVHDFPCFAVSIALLQEGKLQVGMILDPLKGECFSAVQGQGSFLNGQPIQVSSTESLGESLVAVSFPPDLSENSPDLTAFLEVAPRCRAVRRTGSAALNLAYVACGRLDAHWAHQIYPWDSAAGILLVRESGGVASACRGGEYQVADGNYCVASSETLHQELLPRITGFLSA